MEIYYLTARQLNGLGEAYSNSTIQCAICFSGPAGRFLGHLDNRNLPPKADTALRRTRPCCTFQLDWSHEIAFIDGVTTTIKAADAHGRFFNAVELANKLDIESRRSPLSKPGIIAATIYIAIIT